MGWPRVLQRLGSGLEKGGTKDVCLFIIHLLKINLLISKAFKKNMRFLFL